MKTIAILFLICASFTPHAYAQGTAADYERATGLRAKYEAAAIDIASAPTWIGNTHRFWYRKLSRGANEYLIFDETHSRNSPRSIMKRLPGVLQGCCFVCGLPTTSNNSPC